MIDFVGTCANIKATINEIRCS